MSASANQLLKVFALSIVLGACATTSMSKVSNLSPIERPQKVVLSSLQSLPPVSPVLETQILSSAAGVTVPELVADISNAALKPRTRKIIAAVVPAKKLPGAVSIAPPTPRPVLPGSAPVAPAPSAPPPSEIAGMSLGSAVPAPMGFTSFCVAYPNACTNTRASAKFVALDSAGRADLRSLNVRINEAIWPASDDYDADVWTINPEAGDCDDYAVTKRDVLIRMGYPPAALLLTTARTERGEKHLVLVVRTNTGDLVLDNRNDDVRDWRDVRYTWEAQQSAINPKIWQSVISAHSAMASLR